ncbi:MAG: hypothetical protein A4E63_01732 [Syntrophorhabdus sp. PtaU1.Bin050]|nr:MAG: hypothetical protein A4E63_01732 [Syntrophorhabdus sp. PtaU1.Bin050]
MHKDNPLCYPIKTKITEFPLPETQCYDDTVVVPTVKGSLYLKYGKHAYYFYNFKKRRCLCVETSHRAIITPGLPLFIKALGREDTFSARVKLFFERYHYGFSFLEQIMLMTVPHTVTAIGNGKFLVNLWSYVGYLEIDCNTRQVIYRGHKGQDNNHVLGSQQWLHHPSGELYYMAYSLSESLKKISDPYHPVPCKVFKSNRKSGATSEIWNGLLTDYLHDILVDKTGRYCVVCELGMFQDDQKNAIPSKVLVVDIKQRRHWTIEKFIVAAHAQFDPEEPDVIYFSNHNFKFIPSSIFTLLRKAIYSLEFLGPAAVYKYRLTPQGPKEIGIFTEPDMFRLTNFHVFVHRGKKLLTAMGFPNFIYVADTQTMKLIRKITVNNLRSYKYCYRKIPCVIGTFSPSSDGERLYVQTTRSFQVIDVESGDSLSNMPLWFNHTAANHIQATDDTSW